MGKAAVCILALLVGMLGALAAKAQDVSQADKDRALQYLESTKKGVAEVTKGLSGAQWNLKAAPERWSIAEVMEHLAAAEDMIRGMTQEQVMKTPAIPARDTAELKKIDDSVIALVPTARTRRKRPSS
jgi:DinB superfamily